MFVCEHIHVYVLTYIGADTHICMDIDFFDNLRCLANLKHNDSFMFLFLAYFCFISKREKSFQLLCYFIKYNPHVSIL